MLFADIVLLLLAEVVGKNCKFNTILLQQKEQLDKLSKAFFFGEMY